MKILFLDFDGVLNSAQEVILHNREERTSLYWRFIKKIIVPIHWRFYKSLGHWKTTTPLKHFLGRISLRFYSTHETFCPIACSNIQYLLEQVPDLSIVVSSVWRVQGLKYCARVLKQNGIDPDRLLDKTPIGVGKDAEGNPGKSSERGYQIQEWLLENGPVDKFVIVDDDSDMAHLKPFLVKTDNLHGFMFQDMKKALDILGVPAQHHTLFEVKLD